MRPAFRPRRKLFGQVGRNPACVVAILIALCLPFSSRAERINDLESQGYVNDFANVIDAKAQEQLSALCAEVDQKTHAQVAVVTISSLEGLTPEDFANKLFERWGVGHKGENRGVLILLAVRDRKYWTEVGYGLEPILPDGKVGGFGREMVPKLREGDYGGAVLLLTARIAEVIAQDRGVSLGTLPREESKQLAELPPETSGSAHVPAGVLVLAAGVVLLLLLFLGFGLRRLVDTRNLSDLILLALLFGAGRRSGRGHFGGGSFGGFGGGGFGGFGGGASGGGGAGGSW